MKYITCFLFLCTSWMTNAQNHGVKPASFIQFYNHYSFFNPSIFDESLQYKFNFVNQNYTGLLHNVGFFYLNGSLIKKAKNTSTEKGLLFHSEYETELLKRSRASVRYAWKTELSENIFFSGGATMGFYNFFIRGTTSSPGVSKFLLDANVGACLNGKNFNVGFSFNQIPNTSFTPLSQAVYLTRFYTIIADYSINYSTQNTLLIATQVISTESFQVGIENTIFNNYTAGLIYNHLLGTGFSFGLKNFKLNKISGDINFSYLNHSLAFLSPSQNLNNDRVEVGLQLYFDKVTIDHLR